MSEIRVTNVIGENGNSPVNFTKGINMSGICTAPAFIPSQGQLSHRNLTINGAMQVAQRGTSSTSSGFHTVDRFEVEYSGTDEAPTQAQVDVAAGTTPYTLGFRKAFKITNGNQTSGVGASDRIRYRYKFEAQDIATSGWNYTSASSFVTLSFWIKSSVAQNFYGAFLTMDGSQQEYSFETGSLSAGTWTKVTKTIPGNSNLTFNNDNGHGLQFNIFAFLGTSNTGSTTMNQWAAFDNSARTPDNTSTWYTTNDATLEFTGFQLEVGSVATPFEHRSYCEELARCQRYYEHSYNDGIVPGTNSNIGGWYQNQTSDAGNNAAFSIEYKVRKRTAPVTAVFYADDGTANQWDYGRSGASGKATVTYHRNSQTHLNGYLNVGASWASCYVLGHWTAAAEL